VFLGIGAFRDMAFSGYRSVLGTTLVLGILGYQAQFKRFGSYSPISKQKIRTIQAKKRNTETSISSSSYYLSYQGGGDYRGIYDIGFKRGFYGVYRPFIECPLQDR
jgi:hypothetical protein